MYKNNKKEILESYQKIFSKIQEAEDKMNNEFVKFRLTNSDYLRKFWFNIILMTSAIEIAVLPVLLRDVEYFKTPFFVWLGLFSFLFLNVLGVFYLNLLLQKEQRQLSDKHDFMRNNFLELNNMAIGCLSEEERIEEFSNKLNNFNESKNKEDIKMEKKHKEENSTWLDKNFSDLISFFFIFGIILIFFSLFNF